MHVGESCAERDDANKQSNNDDNQDWKTCNMARQFLTVVDLSLAAWPLIHRPGAHLHGVSKKRTLRIVGLSIFWPLLEYYDTELH